MILQHNFITASLTGFAACSSCITQQPTVKPNIIIILADDMGWGDLNLNGNNIVSTPAINALAKQSLSFDRFYVCPEGETGSAFILRSASSAASFYIDIPSDSQILPERDYVKRSESVERTWTWMTAGNLKLRAGSERIALILKEKKKHDAGLIKSVRLTPVNLVTGWP